MALVRFETSKEGERLVPLEPGDRGIRAVRPWAVRSSGGLWGCARCGAEFPDDRSWEVDYWHRDGHRVSFLVCPECARSLLPVRLSIDLTALDTAERDPRWSPVVGLVNDVLQRREDPPSDALPLRAADAHALAASYATSSVQLALDLHEAGLLDRTDLGWGR